MMLKLGSDAGSDGENKEEGEGITGFKLDVRSLNKDFDLPSNFELEKTIGKGVYGKVMQVEDSDNGQKYAIKKFERIFANDLRARRFVREVTIQKELVHPCINRLHKIIPPKDMGKLDEGVFLMLDLCDMDL